MKGLLEKKKKKQGLLQSTSLKETFPLPYIYGKPHSEVREGSASSQKGFQSSSAKRHSSQLTDSFPKVRGYQPKILGQDWLEDLKIS